LQFRGKVAAFLDDVLHVNGRQVTACQNGSHTWAFPGKTMDKVMM
jgi:hypothetical protein